MTFVVVLGDFDGGGCQRLPSVGECRLLLLLLLLLYKILQSFLDDGFHFFGEYDGPSDAWTRWVIPAMMLVVVGQVLLLDQIIKF